MTGKIKLIVEQMLIITFLVLIVITIEMTCEYLNGENPLIEWYIPHSIILCGILTSIPTILIFKSENASKKVARLLTGVHFILCFGITMLIGYLFGWYTKFEYAVSCAISYLVIYTLVWAISIYLRKYEAGMINDALDKIRDEE